MTHYHHYKRNRRNNRYSEEYSSYSKPPRARSKIMGVCSGVAHQLGWDVTGVRIVAVLGLIFFTGPTFLAYIVAGALFY